METEKNFPLKNRKNLLNLVTLKALGKVFLKIAALTAESEDFLAFCGRFFWVLRLTLLKNKRVYFCDYFYIFCVYFIYFYIIFVFFVFGVMHTQVGS